MIKDKKSNNCCADGVYGERLELAKMHTDAPPKTAKSLGTITNLQASNEIKGSGRIDYCEIVARVERFVMQNQACKILFQKNKKMKNNQTIIKEDGTPRLFYKHRVNYCLKRRIDAEKGVSVFYNEERQNSQYGNLQLCGSVWTCPICASRISEGRRLELKKGNDYWKEKGKKVYLVTFTNPHHVGDNLQDLINGQKEAFIKFWERHKVKDTLNLLGYAGRIVSTEVTHGSNGWHPHYHVLFYFDHKINQKSLQSFIALEWSIACSKAGLKVPSLKHGVDVRDGSHADRYVSKWGLEHEMTKAHTKKGKKDSVTPWDMLRLAEEEPKYKSLFAEYADAFFGKQQLTYLPRKNEKKGILGLKQLLAVEDTTDDELANKTEDNSVLIDEIAIEVWQLILNARKRAHYLHATELDQLDQGTRARDMQISLIEESIHFLMMKEEGREREPRDRPPD